MLAKAAGAWEVKQELMMNNPTIAQDITASGSQLSEQMSAITARLGVKPNEVMAAFNDESYKKWIVR